MADTVTISPKFQIVIPLAVRRELGLRPGQKIRVVERDGHIELRVLRPMEDYFGLFPGLDTEIERDADRV